MIDKRLNDARLKYDKIAKFRNDKTITTAIYEYLTTRDADPNMIANDEAREIAVAAKQAIRTMGKQLVARGLMTQEALDKYDDQYLPRLYASFILDDAEMGKTFGGNSSKTMDLTYLKRRMDEMKLPKEFRDLVLGEIKDPAYLVFMALARPSRDLALLEWTQHIAANPEWAMPKMLVDWNINDRPTYSIGEQLLYEKNDDGTFDVTLKKFRRTTQTHSNITKDDITRIIGPAVANFVQRKAQLQWKEDKTGLKYKRNQDGTFDITMNARVADATVHDRVQPDDLEGIVGAQRAGWMKSGKITATTTNSKGEKIETNRPVSSIGGTKVTPFYLFRKAQELEALADSGLAEKPDETRKLAKKARDLARATLEEGGYQFDPATGQLIGTLIPEGWVQLPDSPRYGAVRGLVVRKVIAEDMMASRAKGDRDMVEKFFAPDGILGNIHQVFKQTKTTWNPGTHAANFASNMCLMHINTKMRVDQIPVYMGKAFRSMLTKDKYYRMGIAYGFQSAGFNSNEVRRVNTELLDLKRKAEGMHPIQHAMYYMGLLSNTVGDVYQLSEQFFKTAALIYNIEQQQKAKLKSGDRTAVNVEAAALEAHTALFDYSDVTAAVRTLRTHFLGIPFATYTLKISEQVVRGFGRDIRNTKSAVLKADTFADKALAAWASTHFSRKYVTWQILLKVAPAYIASGALGLGGDDWEKLKEAAMEHVRSKTVLLPMPLWTVAVR